MSDSELKDCECADDDESLEDESLEDESLEDESLEDESCEDESCEDEDLEGEDLEDEDRGASIPYWFCECGHTDLDKAMPKDRKKFYDSVSNGTALKKTKCPRCKSEGSFLPVGF